MRHAIQLTFMLAVFTLGAAAWRLPCASAQGASGAAAAEKPAAVCEGDADCDGLPDVREDANGNGVVDAGETDPKNPDTDGDGLLDGEEGDRDGDGTLGPDETSPLESDTDGDGVLDGEEKRLGTKVNVCDTDGDGLSDGVELGAIQPNDKGGCHGLQPAGTNFKKPHVLDPLNPDSDGDGIRDGEEDQNGNGWLDPEDSDPTITDSDNDGLDDGVETLGDFDGDGVPDYDVRLIKAGQKCTPPETIADVDCDGVPNVRSTDSDSDGCPDALEGGWIDANSNGIPDVYDNQVKSCPDAAAGGTGASAAPSKDDDEGEQEAAGIVAYGADESGACSLVASPGNPEGMRGSRFFPLLQALFAAVFLLGRRFLSRGRV